MLKSPSRTTGPEAMPAAELPRDWLGFGFISVTSAKFRILVETTELLYIPLSLVTRQAPPKGVHGQVIHYPRENEFAGIHAQGRRDDGQEQKRRRHGRGDGPRGDLDEPPYLATSGSIIYKMMMEEWGREGLPKMQNVIVGTNTRQSDAQWQIVAVTETKRIQVGEDSCLRLEL